MASVNIFWFRRDLRLKDNAGLYHALKSDLPVVPVFIFDTNILNDLENKKDRRLVFIREAIEEIQEKLVSFGSTLHIFYSSPKQAFTEILSHYNVEKVFTNNDYEPYATERDKTIQEMLAKKNIEFVSFKDQVIFEKEEVLKDDGKPYTVFTPYSRNGKQSSKISILNLIQQKNILKTSISRSRIKFHL